MSNNYVIQGLGKGIPIVLGYFPIGLAFGVMAAGAGLSIRETTLMSVFVFAGSSQLIFLGLWETQAGLAAITLTTFLVNLRHFLMSAALAPFLGHLKIWQQFLFAYEITDETFAIHVTDFQQEPEPPPARIISTNLAAHSAWVSSSCLGAWLGGLVGDLETWGLDYALPAMFIALLVLQLDSNRRRVIAALSLAGGTLFFQLWGGHWYIIATTLVAATAGLLWDNHASPQPGGENSD